MVFGSDFEESAKNLWESIYRRDLNEEDQFIYDENPLSQNYDFETPVTAFGVQGFEERLYNMGADDSAFLGLSNPAKPGNYLVFELQPDAQVKNDSVRNGVKTTAYSMDLEDVEPDFDVISDKVKQKIEDNDYQGWEGERRHLYWDHPAARSPHRQEFPPFLEETTDEFL